MKKVLIIQEEIPHYRIPIFNRLSLIYDLTVTSINAVSEANFKVKRINLKRYFGFFKITQNTFPDLNQFDAVIFTFNIRFLDLYRLVINSRRKYKLILWGIGVSTNNGYDSSCNWDLIRFWMARRVDSLIFYSLYPIDKYARLGKIPFSKMYWAHNTLDLQPYFSNERKDYFLFVGTLKKYKNIEQLIFVYNEALRIYSAMPPLYIVGSGDFLGDLKKIINFYKIADRVIILGLITDSKHLQDIYRRAIASVSPSQAGLSVLQSMAYGVPFLTMSNSITGGERFNIVNNYNGLIASNVEELVFYLIKLSKDSNFSTTLGENAYGYFTDFCKTTRMISGFTSAIEN